MTTSSTRADDGERSEREQALAARDIEQDARARDLDTRDRDQDTRDRDQDTRDRELNTRDRELLERHGAVDRFVELAGHDLRTPLATLTAVVSTLEDKLEDPSQRALLDVANRNLRRLDRMLTDLLTYARAGFSAGDHTAVDLDAVLARARAQAPDLRVETQPLPVVIGDEMLLEHLFANLLSNAASHAREGKDGEVIITAQRDGQRWTVVVADNGTGIPPAHRDRVLQPFERLESRAPASTGLGLAIVGRVARAHGSDVRIDDSPTGGAAFRFSLPAAEPG